MDSHFEQLLQSVPLSPASRCSYFPERCSRARAFRLEGDIGAGFFESALDRGYRRCGNIYYQQNCRDCRMCISYRIPLARFQPSTSQRRVIRRNRDIDFTIGIPRMTPAKQEIYLRYQEHQHFDRGEDPESKPFDPEKELDTMLFQMYTNPSLTREFELQLRGQIVGFGILDCAVTCVSAVYFVFDPAFSKRSLGSLAILRGMAWAQTLGFQHYHLGFYIPGHPKMDYKYKFQQGELLNRQRGCWEGEPQDPTEFGWRPDAQSAFQQPAAWADDGAE
jgi:arginine-tRNA-protein transferase